ncbi:TPA: hypothetical protein ACG0AP_003492 [Elizabethkingia anophelis]
MKLTENKKEEIKNYVLTEKNKFFEENGLNRPAKTISLFEYQEKVELAKKFAMLMPNNNITTNEEVLFFTSCKNEVINELIDFK